MLSYIEARIAVSANSLAAFISCGSKALSIQIALTPNIITLTPVSDVSPSSVIPWHAGYGFDGEPILHQIEWKALFKWSTFTHIRRSAGKSNEQGASYHISRYRCFIILNLEHSRYESQDIGGNYSQFGSEYFCHNIHTYMYMYIWTSEEMISATTYLHLVANLPWSFSVHSYYYRCLYYTSATLCFLAHSAGKSLKTCTGRVLAFLTLKNRSAWPANKEKHSRGGQGRKL